MPTRSHRIATFALVPVATITLALATTPATAAPVVKEANTDFSTTPATFSFEDSTFTFSGTGDLFNPTAVQTSGGGEVSSFGGFLGIPVQPTTDFYPERGGDVEFGPGIFGSFSPFTTTTTVPYSNGGNIFGLVATSGGSSYYGYALTSNDTLISYGFENVADTAINASAAIRAASAVPETATWIMMILGFGAIGAVMRRAHRKSEERFTSQVRAIAAA
jgi:hypothetical protein